MIGAQARRSSSENGGNPSTETDRASIAGRLRAWLRAHHPLDPSLPNEAALDDWSAATMHLSTAQHGEDQRAQAAAHGLLLVLGCKIDAEHPDFQQLAAAAIATRAVADGVTAWRSSPAIRFLIENSLSRHRRMAAVIFANAEAKAHTRTPSWRWTVWLAAALANGWLQWPCVIAARVAQTRERWWRWTAWLAAAMGTRRIGFTTYDLPERFELVATVAMELQALASTLAGMLHSPSPELLTPRPGRPTDHLRRELAEILRAGGFSRSEIADLIEDPVEAKVERLRGRSRRAKQVALRRGSRRASRGKS